MIYDSPLSFSQVSVKLETSVRDGLRFTRTLRRRRLGRHGACQRPTLAPDEFLLVYDCCCPCWGDFRMGNGGVFTGASAEPVDGLLPIGAIGAEVRVGFGAACRPAWTAPTWRQPGSGEALTPLAPRVSIVTPGSAEAQRPRCAQQLITVDAGSRPHVTGAAALTWRHPAGMLYDITIRGGLEEPSLGLSGLSFTQRAEAGRYRVPIVRSFADATTGRARLELATGDALPSPVIIAGHTGAEPDLNGTHVVDAEGALPLRLQKPGTGGTIQVAAAPAPPVVITRADSGAGACAGA